MKLSFSLSSSKPPKPTLKSLQDQPSSSLKKEFVTEFDPSKSLADRNSKNPVVIAPISNEWRPQKKMRNIDLPVKSDDPNLEFEVMNHTVEQTDPNITYGLNLRGKKDSAPDSESKVQRSQSTSSIDNLMLNKLRNDLERLPEDRGMEEFEDMSVEDFASALLKGYGWVEGRGIGKNAKEDVKVVEYTKRTGKEGLGFVNDMPMPPTTESNNRSTKTKTEGVSNGERKESSGDRRSREEVKGRSGGGDRRSKDSTVHRSHSQRDESSYDKRKGSKRRHEISPAPTTSKSWLNSHIRVRIISKQLKGGRLYLQKGEIVDVVGPTTCDISMDNSRELVQGVEQEFLETALPRRGGPVLVLYGRHKGVYGSLQEKDNDNETAVVRDADTHALINVRLEQIAEYLGDPDDIGY
ncbi:protein MOS2 [Lactuca sativa]|uniref:G-patch domain-containing protein n=1 Tax=Lactuca sativa TaxID=4236 RepID=A0A9R1V8F7_LACSA|nr:protein MOS2 [Lactuca sativa]KAJ0200337.1 hypothetical protein LSAT_V11C600299500 [Lactuca sativa]